MMALLGLRFLAELGMLFCLAVGGWQLGDSLIVSIALGAVLPVSAGLVWGRWVAPRADGRLRDPVRLGVEVMLFAAALMAVVPAEPTPAMAVVGVLVWAAFLVSIPARRHEPVPGVRV